MPWGVLCRAAVPPFSPSRAPILLPPLQLCRGLPLRGNTAILAFGMFNYCQLMMINLQLTASKG